LNKVNKPWKNLFKRAVRNSGYKERLLIEEFKRRMDGRIRR